ncbi:MAG: CoA transferase [Chloroflexi bacterium]|nr:CoA transferase [Chloroflexota bacterium]
MPMALEGTKVLDLSRYAPGLYCSMILGDMGADVIRIEEPEARGRRAALQTTVTSPVRDKVDARATAHHVLDRNKRSIAIDLKNEAGRTLFYRMVETADVLLEGYRPGVAKRLGVGYDDLSRINPRLVYCSLTGYGQDGPYQNLVGHDINYISIAGALGVIGLKDSPPAIPNNFLADYAGGGLHAALGICLALLARHKTGCGQYVDTSMTDGVVSLMCHLYAEYFNDGKVPQRGAEQLNGAAPYYHVYQTKDNKWISVGSIEPYFYESLCKLLGCEDCIPNQHDSSLWPQRIERFGKAFRQRTRDEWFQRMSEVDVCVGKIYDMNEVENDPQMRHRQMVIEVPHAELGNIKQVGIAVKLSATPGKVRRLAPTRGQDTDAVLQEYGYSAGEIARLRESGAVR